MIIGRVMGSVVATVKDPQLRGLKLLLVREATPDNRTFGRAFIAVDAVGAGEGELVGVTMGSSSRYAERLGKRDIACDAAIVAILDSVEVDGKTTYKAGNS